ncbi:CocE/NonD family hydrolase [Nocardia mexicana]|uniref:X-Pro dipeptidyl-peptidase-like protein n=1 Tax=Nocardia mexicana TaxID=279262 RepID=A0A370HCB9_9NOCA|nr:CocE/NonD family hydrolase [Nocardia mexicana]RDI54586.1 X-Pro dipeptidyl-peptidase-like protein [Nocardia mexicana]
MPKRLFAVTVAAILAAAIIAACAPRVVAVPIPGAQATTLFVPGADGVLLNAVITAPPDLAEHKNPLVLQPSGWGMPAMGSIGSAYRLSSGAGFVSIEYTARGMYLSGGEVDLLGDRDARDASAVIDWAIANLNVDPDRIAIAGGSYGAGLSLLAAAHDPRIKAIVADSPPADGTAALAPNGTLKTGGPAALALTGASTNRFSPEMTAAGLHAILTTDPSSLAALTNTRLLADAVDTLNANGTAVFLAHDWQDSLLPVGPVFHLFDRLTGPKMLYLQPGDHSTGGGPGQVAGLPNPVWDAGIRWLDHHLNGAPNGIDTEPVVNLAPADGGPYDGYRSVADAVPAAQAFPLSAPAAGVLGADPGDSWSQPLRSGATTAVSAVPYVTGSLAQLGSAPPIPLGSVDRTLAGVWHTAPFDAGARIAGSPRLDLTVIPPTADLSLFGILYDEAPDGSGTPVTYWPITRHDLRPGQPNAVAWELSPTYWKLAPGHRLALTVTSQDPVPFVSATPVGSTVTFAAPSTVEIPVGAA